MNDDCDHELAVAAKQTELGGSNGSGSGVLANRTSGGGEVAAPRANAAPDEVRQLVRAAAELFAPEIAAAYPASGASRTNARAKRESAVQVPDGVRDLIRATAEIFGSADSDGSDSASDANWDSGFEAALSNIDAEAFASDADAGAADDPEDTLATAVLNHIDTVASATSLVDAEDAVFEADPDAPELSEKVKPRVRTKRTRMRSKTIAMKRLTRAELQRGAIAHPPVEGVDRPTVRSECAEGMRPCPWVACKHHLYLDINPRTGSIKINFPDLEPWELQHTCALDVADNGGLTLEEIGLITNLTRERVRQVEVRGLLTLRTRSNALR